MTLPAIWELLNSLQKSIFHDSSFKLPTCPNFCSRYPRFLQFEPQPGPIIIKINCIRHEDLSGATLGYDFKGSVSCYKCGHIRIIHDYVRDIDENRIYGNHQYIACSIDNALKGGECLFTYRMGDETIIGEEVKDKLVELIKQGRQGWGSVPVYPATTSTRHQDM
ncbi:hypothetical protein K469DRAFT_793265 [Zopfia rhizophila CBS 207.26]|uniref:Killer toxin Kp4 domain-containing protein n=1 Tax=Zopfia rhizophila CBS 207.26 TaxID=1314779 RepID=A0A6A6DPB5_9PEZI|nr:hypothetical protein K469DRAFT_793265 [Zopfia rhizophila CBS 207.26]